MTSTLKSHLVSVITPAYNAEKFIAQAIQSVLNQSYSNWELIIVNDGSNDGTEGIVNGYKDFRIRYFKQQNQGVSSARNKAIKEMRGDFFCFLDADDLLTITSIEERLNIFEDADYAIDFVTGGQEVRDHKLEQIIRVQIPSFNGNPSRAMARLDSDCFVNCGTWLIKRKSDIHYRFETNWSHLEDALFFFTIGQRGILRSCNKIVQIYRLSPDSAMSNLEGLALGYFCYYRALKNQILNKDLRILKLRILRAMATTFLRRGQITRQLYWVARYLVM